MIITKIYETQNLLSLELVSFLVGLRTYQQPCIKVQLTKSYRILVWKPEGKRPLGRYRRRWEDNIKMDLQKVRGGGIDWIELVQDRDRWRAIVNVEMELRVP
jgi:hypothetical protein